MQYMTLPRSCAYTAVANLLEAQGIAASDREILLEIGIPYTFRQEGDSYLAGTMLQTRDWFNRFLMPRGFHLIEEAFSPSALISHLTQQPNSCMLGVQLEHGKHAVNFHHWENGTLVFTNNRHPQSPEPDSFSFSPRELLARVSDPVVVGALEACVPSLPDTSEDPAKTQTAFTAYRETLTDLWHRSFPRAQLLRRLDPVFAPLFLDGPIMMELIGKSRLAQAMVSMRTVFLAALRQADSIRLDTAIAPEALAALLDDYQAILFHPAVGGK